MAAFFLLPDVMGEGVEEHYGKVLYKECAIEEGKCIALEIQVNFFILKSGGSEGF